MPAINRYWKSIVAFIAPGAVLLGAATMDETPGGESITQGEFVRAVVAMIVTAGAVLVVPGDPVRKAEVSKSASSNEGPTGRHVV